MSQRSFDAGQRPMPGPQIRNDRHADILVRLRIIGGDDNILDARLPELSQLPVYNGHTWFQDDSAFRYATITGSFTSGQNGCGDVSFHGPYRVLQLMKNGREGPPGMGEDGPELDRLEQTNDLPVIVDIDIQG